MTTALQEDEGSASHPGRALHPGKTRYPLYRRLGGPQGRYGHVRKISPPQGFDPRTAQPVASRYTDFATRLTSCRRELHKFAKNIRATSQFQDPQILGVTVDYFLHGTWVEVPLYTVIFTNHGASDGTARRCVSE
jgi:hypothetical protein